MVQFLAIGPFVQNGLVVHHVPHTQGSLVRDLLREVAWPGGWPVRQAPALEGPATGCQRPTPEGAGRHRAGGQLEDLVAATGLGGGPDGQDEGGDVEDD